MILNLEEDLNVEHERQYEFELVYQIPKCICARDSLS